MTPALARLKRELRVAIHKLGGVDGAAATAHRRRSVAGDWNNLSCPVFPPLDCAFDLDEALVATGVGPLIVSALARELGGVFVPLPDVAADPDTLAGQVMQISARLGELSQEMATALADRAVDAREAARLLDRLADLDAESAQLRLALQAIVKSDGE